jgi:hypothetical protein
MKILGFMFLPMGWAIAIAALVLFPPAALGNSFVFAGLAIQIAGVGFVFTGMRRRNEMRR